MTPASVLCGRSGLSAFSTTGKPSASAAAPLPRRSASAARPPPEHRTAREPPSPRRSVSGRPQRRGSALQPWPWRLAGDRRGAVRRARRAQCGAPVPGGERGEAAVAGVEQRDIRLDFGLLHAGAVAPFAEPDAADHLAVLAGTARSTAAAAPRRLRWHRRPARPAPRIRHGPATPRRRPAASPGCVITCAVTSHGIARGAELGDVAFPGSRAPRRRAAATARRAARRGRPP